jgi:hypothetical protein
VGVLFHDKRTEKLSVFPIFSQSPFPTMSSASVDLRRLVKNHPILSASGTAAVVIGALATRYHDRALFHPARPDIARYPGWPLLGNLPLLIQYKDKIYDFFTEGFAEVRSPTM